MKKYLYSPFYTFDKNELKYLGLYKICNLPNEEEIKLDILRREGAIIECPSKYKRKKNTVLVLEPHADDFVLSTLAFCLNKHNVEVLNIFSKTTLKYFPWIDKIKLNSLEYENIRIKESEFVVKKVLNEEFNSMREESIRITKKDINEVKNNITKKVEFLLNNNDSINTILVPMGIGEHPDHIVVFDAIIDNYEKFKNYNIILYPEYPYARCKKSYISRLNKIKNKFKIKNLFVSLDNNIETIVDCISLYKSQFDDINRDQMLGIVREDCRAISTEYNLDGLNLIYFKIL